MKNNANDYANKVTGIIVETGSIIEAMINNIISYYLCKHGNVKKSENAENDNRKIDGCIGFVQETSFIHRINYLTLILKELDKEHQTVFSTKEYEFKYLFKLTKNKEKIYKLKLVEVIDLLRALRNIFAHCIKFEIETIEGEKHAFCLQEFRPISSNSNIKQNPINDTIERFSNNDFDNLSMDMRGITTQLTQIYIRVGGLGN